MSVLRRTLIIVEIVQKREKLTKSAWINFFH